MSQEKQQQQQQFLDPNFFRPKFFSGPNFFWTQTFSGKIFFVGRKQSFSTISFLKWQRVKVLLKLEFDTEDQVLLTFVKIC